ncbi:jg6337 [Pararge aegeria aegeria]|uniref:Jg6337 protein n=1 Tax=Pararge aegeria aegeria TaxID=348720 RepID=A0A8S4RQS5_9NEOP|nr:jg6337 [Pararge aegeria aegeria]
MLEEFGHLQVGDVLATVSVEPRDPDTHYQESDWQHECAESEVKQLEQDFLDGVHATNAGVGRKSNNSNKISSTVFTPPTPESAGYGHFLKNL